MGNRQVVVIGAGPAGIASAVALKDVGLRPLVLDQADQVGSSWRSRYDGLRLNTCRPFSHLPKRNFAKGTPMFPSRDQVVEHLEAHAREDGIDLQLGTRVERLERDGADWVVQTSAGPVRTPQVIVATGYDRDPIIPDWRGRESFAGQVLHSSEFKNAEPFSDQRVLVVGPGCSGMEIAYHLTAGGAAKVWLAARTPPNIILREGPGGFPGDALGVLLLRFPARVGDAVTRFARRQDIGDLTEYGLPVPEEGVLSRLQRTGQAPAIVDREVIDAIKARQIEVVGGVESLEADGVRLADGGRVEPEVIIAATGYRRGLEPLVGHLGVLDDGGTPREVGEVAAAPGLRFIGFVPRPGGLGFMSKQARRAAKRIARELQSRPPAQRSGAQASGAAAPA